MSKFAISQPQDKMMDLLIVGLGPAGVACALQAKRDGLDLVAVGDEPIGGLVRAARRLDNLPAEPAVSGVELCSRLARHVELAQVPIVMGRVENLIRSEQGYKAKIRGCGRVSVRAVCLATGTRPRNWDVHTGGQSVLRDARELPDSLVGQDVVVVGGGEAALDTALTSRDRGANVWVLARSERLRAAECLVEEARASGVKILTRCPIDHLAGGAGDWQIYFGKQESLSAHHLVVCIGRIARCELLNQVMTGDFKRDVVQPASKKLFLAGDLIRGTHRYVATAFGDGQRAALAAFHCLKETKPC